MNNGKKWLIRALISVVGVATWLNVLAADCPHGQSDLQPTIDAYSRALLMSDPAHASQNINLVTNIVTGNSAAVRELISSGISPNTVLHLPGGTAISLVGIAASACQDHVASVLLNAGADPNGDGSTTVPLTSAAVSGDVSLTELLLDHGAKIDKVDADGHTPLEAAVRVRQLATVKLLLKHDPNPNREIGRGGTVLDVVGHSSDPTDAAIAQELRSHGVTSTLRAESH